MCPFSKEESLVSASFPMGKGENIILNCERVAEVLINVSASSFSLNIKCTLKFPGLLEDKRYLIDGGS